MSLQPICPGSGRLGAGHRSLRRKGPVACAWCKAWFADAVLVRSRSTYLDYEPLGLIPQHRRQER